MASRNVDRDFFKKMEEWKNSYNVSEEKNENKEDINLNNYKETKKEDIAMEER